MVLYLSTQKRGVAQLVERVVWDHEVARSIRVTPTILDRFLGKFNRILKQSKIFKSAIF